MDTHHLSQVLLSEASNHTSHQTNFLCEHWAHIAKALGSTYQKALDLVINASPTIQPFIVMTCLTMINLTHWAGT